MKIKDGYILREVAGNSIVIAVGQEAINFNALITINETGSFLWKQLAEDKSREELLAAVLEEYEVDEAQALKDIDQFLEKLQKENLLV